MKIVGVMIAYDEHPHWLATAVSGFAQVCHDIVYVDGSYALYPQAKPRSHPSEPEAVMQACDAAGVGCVVYRPSSVFMDNEVEKRNMSLRLAGTLDPEWIVVFDADYHVTSVDVTSFRFDLATTDRNSATFKRIDTDGERRWVTRNRGIYRWTDDLAYGPAHWTISGTYDGEKQWIWGPEHVPGGASNVSPTLDLDSLTCIHRTHDRLTERKNAMTAYNTIRDTYEVEKVDRSVFEAERALA